MHIPDDVTLPQFLFDQHHPLGGEALHSRKPTYFIDDATGRHISGEEVTIYAHFQRPYRAPETDWAWACANESG